MDKLQVRRQVLELLEQNSEEVVSLLAELVRTRSVNPRLDPQSPGERAMGEKVKEWLEGCGFAVEVKQFAPGRPNIIGRRKGRRGTPRLLVNAHMDTVKARASDTWVDPETGELLTGWSVDPFAAEIRDGVLYGRGACDHKGPLAAMLAAAKALAWAGVVLEGDLVFVADSDEETGSEAGLKQIAPELMAEGIDHAIYALTTDFTEFARGYFNGMGQSNVIHAALGFQEYSVKVKAPVYHLVTPKTTEGAIPAALKVIEAINELAAKVNERVSPVTGRGHRLMQVTGIYSEQDVVLFPAKICDIRVGRYYGPEEDPQEVAREFVDFVKQVVMKQVVTQEGVSVEVEITREMPALNVPPDDKLVQITKEAVREVRGSEPKVAGLPLTVGLTQAGITAPAVLFGFGSINFHHSYDERIKVQDIIDTAKVYALVFIDYLGIAQD